MIYENPHEEACPKCGLNFRMPQEYPMAGYKPHPVQRQCCCAPETFAIYSSTLEEDLGGLVKTAVSNLERRLNEQARFIKVLLTMIPRSVGSVPETYSPPGFMELERFERNPPDLPEELLRKMVACADARNATKPSGQGAKYSFCLICGDSYEIGRTDTPESEVSQRSTCHSCGTIQKNHPDVFAWIWRIIRWNLYLWTMKIPHQPKETLGRNIITE